MGVRIDQITFSTLFESYKNYATPTGTLTIPAVAMADGATNNYSVTIPYARAGTRADIYLDGDSVKTLANASLALSTGGPYQFVEFETADIFTDYDTSSITVTISIFNGNGHVINLIGQTITVSAVQYDAPISGI